MRVLLAAVGTRGDVQPALALALELRKLGHAVRMCTSPNFVAWAKRLGIEAVPMGVEMRMPKGGASPKLTCEELRRLRESKRSEIRPWSPVRARSRAVSSGMAHQSRGAAFERGIRLSGRYLRFARVFFLPCALRFLAAAFRLLAIGSAAAYSSRRRTQYCERPPSSRPFGTRSM